MSESAEPAAPSESVAQADPHCLVLTKLLPLPADTGGKLRTLAFLERLAARVPVTLVAFDEGDADIAALESLGIQVRSVPWTRRPRDLLEGFVRSASITSARFWSSELAAAAREVAEAHPRGILLVEFAQLEPWARGLPARRRLLATQNIESALLRSYAATAGPLRRALLWAEAAAVGRLESRLHRAFDVVAVVSQPDAGRLDARRDRPEAVVVCPNGLDPGELLEPAAEPVAAFVASFGWAPNVDAAAWFGREVWPLVVDKLPEARLLLVGRSPASAVLALAGPTVEVTGTVPEVAPYLRRARVALAPLRSGGGTRLKILEALGAGRPVVATTAGAEGLHDLVGRGVVLADEPAAMALAIVELLLDPARAGALGRAGHEAVNERYSWDATLAPLFAAIG